MGSITNICRVYISGPLHAAKDLDAARALYEDIAEICVAAGARPYLPHKKTDPKHHHTASPESVFESDISALRASNLIVADIGAPSSGVGAELAIACERGISVVAFHRSNEVPSRFLEGMLQRSASATVVQADTPADLETHVRAAVHAVGPVIPAIA